MISGKDPFLMDQMDLYNAYNDLKEENAKLISKMRWMEMKLKAVNETNINIVNSLGKMKTKLFFYEARMKEVDPNFDVPDEIKDLTR